MPSPILPYGVDSLVIFGDFWPPFSLRVHVLHGDLNLTSTNWPPAGRFRRSSRCSVRAWTLRAWATPGESRAGSHRLGRWLYGMHYCMGFLFHVLRVILLRCARVTFVNRTGRCRFAVVCSFYFFLPSIFWSIYCPDSCPNSCGTTRSDP